MMMVSDNKKCKTTGASRPFDRITNQPIGCVLMNYQSETFINQMNLFTNIKAASNNSLMCAEQL